MKPIIIGNLASMDSYAKDRGDLSKIAQELKRIADNSEIKICTECYGVIQGNPKHKIWYGELKEICYDCWLEI